VIVKVVLIEANSVVENRVGENGITKRKGEVGMG
jgi:hypothetical protein